MRHPKPFCETCGLQLGEHARWCDLCADTEPDVVGSVNPARRVGLPNLTAGRGRSGHLENVEPVPQKVRDVQSDSNDQPPQEPVEPVEWAGI